MPFARRLAHVLALAAGAYAGIVLLGAASLYSVGRVWIVPSLLGGLLAAVPQAAPVARSSLGRRLPWPLAGMVAWFCWAGALQASGRLAVALVEPGLVDPRELAQVALPTLLAGSLVVAGVYAALVRNRAERWPFALTLAAGHFLAGAAAVTAARASRPFEGAAIAALALAGSFLVATRGQGTTTSE
jgi:hypothetical protein